MHTAVYGASLFIALAALVASPASIALASFAMEEIALLAPSLAAEGRRLFGRGMTIREVDAGSCNGCELENHPLNNAYYDIERF